MGIERTVLTEDEILAIEILEKAGWVFMSELTVEKATPEGERWPLFTEGGEFAMGVLRSEVPKPFGLKPKKKAGGKK